MRRRGPAPAGALVDLGGEHLGQIAPVGHLHPGRLISQGGGLVAHGRQVQITTGGADGRLGRLLGQDGGGGLTGGPHVLTRR